VTHDRDSIKNRESISKTAKWVKRSLKAKPALGLRIAKQQRTSHLLALVALSRYQVGNNGVRKCKIFGRPTKKIKIL
jgi:hypothetical protein